MKDSVHAGGRALTSLGDQEGKGFPQSILELTAWGLVAWNPGMLGFGFSEVLQFGSSLWCAQTADIWDPQGWYCAAHCQGHGVVPHVLRL